MKLAIMQPYFLPYIGYWQLINSVDKYVIYDDVNFIKGGWINRNRVLMNGEAKMINVQLSGASPNKLINEVKLMGNKIYNEKMLKTIENCYKKAPHFVNVFPMIEEIIDYDGKYLYPYLEYSIRRICEYLLIDTELIVSSTIDKDNDLKGKNKVLEICKLLNSKKYFNSIGGQQLYNYEDFASRHIKLKFLKTGKIEYKQFDNEFIPNLSIIDVMMFNSVEEINIFLNDYELL